MRALADQIEGNAGNVIPPAADEMAVDFILTRAPPHPQQLPNQGSEPGWDSHVYARARHTSLVLPCEGPPEDDDDSELDASDGFIKVAT